MKSKKSNRCSLPRVAIASWRSGGGHVHGAARAGRIRQGVRDEGRCGMGTGKKATGTPIKIGGSTC